MSARSRLSAVLLALSVGALGACGGDSSGGLDTSNFTEQQKVGMSLARNSGCVACHGVNFQGGLGPTFVGLAGSTVQLHDGGTVVADDAYLFEAIRDPAATRVKDYPLVMPPSPLPDADVQALVEFIKALKK